MRKNINHDVHIATTRNELIDLLNSKCTVIEVTSSALNEFEKEYKEDKKTQKETKAMRNMGAVAFLLGPVAPVWMVITGGLTLLSGLAAAGCDYKKYALATPFYNMKTHTLLIRYSEYDDKLDTIKGFEYLCFSEKDKCPKCGKKIKVDKKSTHPTICKNCLANVVVYYK